MYSLNLDSDPSRLLENIPNKTKTPSCDVSPRGHGYRKEQHGRKEEGNRGTAGTATTDTVILGIGQGQHGSASRPDHQKYVENEVPDPPRLIAIPLPRSGVQWSGLRFRAQGLLDSHHCSSDMTGVL